MSLLRPRMGSDILSHVRVCMSVCPPAHLRSSEQHVTNNLHQFLCMLPMAVARSSSGAVAIRYVLPVLLVTSRLHTMARKRRREKADTQRLDKG